MSEPNPVVFSLIMLGILFIMPMAVSRFFKAVDRLSKNKEVAKRVAVETALRTMKEHSKHGYDDYTVFTSTLASEGWTIKPKKG